MVTAPAVAEADALPPDEHRCVGDRKEMSAEENPKTGSQDEPVQEKKLCYDLEQAARGAPDSASTQSSHPPLSLEATARNDDGDVNASGESCKQDNLHKSCGTTQASSKLYYDLQPEAVATSSSVGEEELDALNLEPPSPCDTISSSASTVVFPEFAENNENDCQNGKGAGTKKRKHAEPKADHPKKKYKPNSPLGDVETATALEDATTISPANTIDSVPSSDSSAKSARPEKGQRYELGTKVAKMFRDDSRAREKKRQLGNLVYCEGDGEGVMVKKDFLDKVPKLGKVIEYDSRCETYKIRYECNLEECEHEEDLAKLVIPDMPCTSDKPITPSKEEKIPLELQGMKKYERDPRGKKPVNIDRDVFDDPNWHADYCEEMYTSHRIREASLAARPRYIKSQPDLNEKMRAILVDWLIEVHLKFKLVPEALHLTVNLVDRYLDIDEVVPRSKLQLVGMAAIFIASKFEDNWPPELRDLVYICDRAYSKDEILDMETKILARLDYRVRAPTPHTFLSRYLKAAHCDERMICLANLVVDAALLSYDLLHYTPSQIAASAVLIARKTLARDKVVWSPTLIKYTHFIEADVEPVAKAILLAKSRVPSSLTGLDHKYSREEYCRVSDEELGADLFSGRNAGPGKEAPGADAPETRGPERAEPVPGTTRPGGARKKAAAHTILSDAAAPPAASRPPTRSKGPNKKQAREEALVKARALAEARRSGDAAFAK